jgi:hypothetical protein
MRATTCLRKSWEYLVHVRLPTLLFAQSRSQRSTKSRTVWLEGSTWTPLAMAARILLASASASFRLPFNVAYLVSRFPAGSRPASYLRRQECLPRRVKLPLTMFLPGRIAAD